MHTKPHNSAGLLLALLLSHDFLGESAFPRGEAGVCDEVGALLGRTDDRLLAAPGRDLAVVAGQEDHWDVHAAVAGGARLLGKLQQPFCEGLLHRAALVAQHAGDEAHHGV